MCGYCLLRSDFRFFKLTCIKDIEVLPDTFTRETSSIPQIKAIIRSEQTVPVRLKFIPQAAFRVYDEFPDSITEDSDGNLYVTIDLPDNEVMYSYLFSFGNSVEIIEPESVRDNIRKMLHLMLNKYDT